MLEINILGSTPSHSYTYFCETSYTFILENECIIHKKTRLGGDHKREIIDENRKYPLTRESMNYIHSLIYDKGCNSRRADSLLRKIKEFYGFHDCPECSTREKQSFLVNGECWWCGFNEKKEV